VQKIKAKGQLVSKIEWKQMYGGDCITSCAITVGKNFLNDFEFWSLLSVLLSTVVWALPQTPLGLMALPRSIA